MTTKQKLSHKKPTCRYCEDDRTFICITCNKKMNCRKITKCKTCGDIYCRPKYEPISAGILIIDLTDEPSVFLVKETTGKLNDPGGKLDADLDRSHMHTAFREIKEEMGMLIAKPIWEMPSVNLGRSYRCYIAIHTKSSPVFIDAKKSADLAVVKISIANLLKEENLSSRFNLLMDRPLYCKNVKKMTITLRDYLSEQMLVSTFSKIDV